MTFFLGMVASVAGGALAYGVQRAVERARRRPASRRRRLYGPGPGVAMGAPVDLAYDRDAVRNQLGQLGVLPFTRGPVDEGFLSTTRYPTDPTPQELDNLWRMVNEDTSHPTLRPQGTATFQEGGDAVT